MRKLLFIPAVVALSAFLGGFAAVHAELPNAAMAQSQEPSPVPTTNGDMRSIIDRMEKRLSANVSGTSDRQYVATMGALSPAIVAACKREIRVESDPKVRATAQKILTVEQENETYLRQYADTFHVDHSP